MDHSLKIWEINEEKVRKAIQESYTYNPARNNRFQNKFFLFLFIYSVKYYINFTEC